MLLNKKGVAIMQRLDMKKERLFLLNYTDFYFC